MFCANCGQELQDDAKFCHSCGLTVGTEAAPVQETVQEAAPVWENAGAVNVNVPAQPKKAPKFLIPVVAGVAVLALVVVLITTLFGGPSAKLMKAVAKSGKAYTTAVEKMDLPDLNALVEKQAYSMEMSMWLDEMEYYEELSGLGIRMTADLNMSKREMGMTIAPYLGSADLLNAQLKLDDSKIYVSGGDLTGGKFYMINTETLGQDLNNMGMDASELENLGFNIFDMAEQMQKMAEDNEQISKDVEKAVKAFTKEIEVDKTGSETIEVNDSDLKCTGYHVVIPEDAMKTLIDALEDAYGKLNDATIDGYMDVIGSMGLPEYAMEEMEYSMENADSDYEYMFEAMEEAVDELGDIEVDAYVNGGYLVAVIYEKEIDGSELEIELNLGGGKEYVDDLSLRMNMDGDEYIITSTGNHSGKDGKFTDETTFENRWEDYHYVMLETELSYEPKAKSDNFHFAMDVEEGDTVMELNGQLNTTGDSLHMILDEVSYSDYYDEVTFGLEYKIGKYNAASINTGNAVALGELTQDELMDEMTAIEEYAGEWAYGIMEQFPDLMYLFY